MAYGTQEVTTQKINTDFDKTPPAIGGVGPNQQEYDTSGRPIAPDFGDLRGLKDPGEYMYKGDLRMDDQGGRMGLGFLQDEASRTGPSAWRSLEQGRQLDGLQQQGAGQLQQGMNQMAMQGGLRGGASERMANQHMRQQLTGGQGIRSQMGVQDEARKWSAMQALPGQELADAKYGSNIDQFNIRNAMNTQRDANKHELDAYHSRMKDWAALETAKAM